MTSNPTSFLRATLVTFSFLLAGAGLARAEPLPTLTVQPHAVALTFPADAVVEAVQQAIIAAQVAGRVTEVKADAGQLVKKGDVLMRIDAREAAEAAAAAQAQYVNAKANYDRQVSLKQQKFVSQAAVDKAKADLDAASANRSATAASQSHATIIAPVSGVVARRHTELGEMAAPGKPLFTLYEPGGLRVTASIPQNRLAEMRGVKGAQVEFPEQKRWVQATSVQVLPTVDTATHVSEARVNLPATPELAAAITPGMAARVYFMTGQATKLTVPVAALVRRGEVAGIYVQAADGRLSLRQLRLGDVVGNGEIEVLAGLTSGEKVVTDPVKAVIALKAVAQTPGK